MQWLRLMLLSILILRMARAMQPNGYLPDAFFVVNLFYFFALQSCLYLLDCSGIDIQHLIHEVVYARSLGGGCGKLQLCAHILFLFNWPFFWSLQGRMVAKIKLFIIVVSVLTHTC